MDASVKSAFPLVLFKFKIVMPQVFRFQVHEIQRSEARRIDEIGVLAARKELDMPRRILSPADLPAQFPGLHARAGADRLSLARAAASLAGAEVGGAWPDGRGGRPLQPVGSRERRPRDVR